MTVAVFVTDATFRNVLYLAAFSLFIVGLSGLTGPRTAVRGNRLAAIGMGVAIVATLLRPEVHDAGLIVLGVAIGVAVALPAARRVKMTQMPQMVALFNGVGGGAVALIAWAEFRNSGGYADVATYIAIFSVFAAIVGSVSFWGSLVAFAKLQGLITGNPVTVGRLQLPLNATIAVAGSLAASRSLPAAIRSCGSSRCSSAPQHSARCSCCRSAAPTCPSSSRCSTRSPGCPPPRSALRSATPR